MFSSLRFRLWLTYVLLAGMVLGTVGIAMVFFLIRNPAADRREIQRLRLISGLIENQSNNFQQALESDSEEIIKKAVVRVDRQLGVRAAVFTEGGQLLADSRQGFAANLPEWLDLTSGRSTIFRDSSRRQWIYIITSFPSGGYLLLALPRLRTPVLAILREEFLPPFGRGMLLALAFSLFMAIWISEWVSRPLRRMASAVREISEQKFHVFELDGPREVRELAKAFNEMEDRVLASRKSQQDFVANVSHELKTPLTSIQGFAQAIMDGTVEGSEAVMQSAAVIYEEAGRMNCMVMDLLELARYDSGMATLELSEVKPEILLREVVNRFKKVAEKNQVNLLLETEIATAIDFSSNSEIGEFDEKTERLMVDVDRLKQVLSNLIENGLKFTPAGGYVVVGVAFADDWVEMRVEDSGPGIPPEEVDRVFERFYQMDKSRRGGSQRGVGLGLAIAKQIVEAHGGSIQVKNKPDSNETAHKIYSSGSTGTGCIFTVRLPIIQSDRPDSSNRKAKGKSTLSGFSRRQ